MLYDLFIEFFYSDSSEGDLEMALIEDLSLNYNQYARPAQNENEPLDISFGLALQQIIDVVSPAW